MKKLIKIQFVILYLSSAYSISFGQNMMISGGHLHTVAVCANGNVYHAGDRNNNQNGTGMWDGTNNLVLTPVPGVGGVGNLTGVQMIDGGSTHHSIALTNAGEVLAFGNDYACQLGQGGVSGTYPANPSPVRGIGGVGNLTGIRYIAASSESSYAIRSSDGALIAWGNNNVGQLGIGSAGGIQCNPVEVLAPCNSNVVQVDGGDNFAIALLSNGNVYAWGENANGQLGIGNTTDQSSPQQVMISPGVPLANVISISCGDGTSYAIRSDGTLWAWGHNGWGQMGIGNCNPINTYAVQVRTGDQGDASGFLQNVSQVVGGNGHALVLLNNGTVYSMGSDQYGQLGDGTVGGADACGLGIGCKNLPYRISSLSNISSVSDGDHWSFAADNTGQVFAWGRNNEGQLGINSGAATNPTPTAMTMPAGCSILPVDLISFNASLGKNGNVELQWTTASEINTNKFEVYRSENGIDFIFIGEITAAGNSSSIQNYTYTDYYVNKITDAAYYKLRIVDIDGSAEYSNIEYINPVNENASIIAFPNPVNQGSNLSLLFHQKWPGLIKIQLTDVVSQTVSEFENEVLRSGNDEVIELPVSAIASGIYIIKIIFIDRVEEKKIVIK